MPSALVLVHWLAGLAWEAALGPEPVARLLEIVLPQTQRWRLVAQQLLRHWQSWQRKQMVL